MLNIQAIPLVQIYHQQAIAEKFSEMVVTMNILVLFGCDRIFFL
ncbi:hypothetical protein [Chroococcidiopsis sp.]